MTPEQPALKSCPFCGGKPKPVNFDVHKTYRGYEWIECESCGLMVEPRENSTVEQLVAAWNRRSGSAGQWRPLTQEDAPEPGTRILGIWPDGFIETVEWSAFWGEVDDLPTHWQPLPPPPGAREG